MNCKPIVKVLNVPNNRHLLKLLTIAIFMVCLSVCPMAYGVNNQSPTPVSQKIAISVEPRIELIGIVFRLAGNPEYKQCRIPSYVTDIERHFGDFDQHPAVKLASRLRYTRSMSCDGPMSLTIYIDNDFNPLKSFEQWPWGLDGRWKKEETREFLEKLRQFAVETKFDEFFKAHKPMYDKALDSCRTIMDQYDLEEWLDEYFGVAKGDDLKMVLGLTNGCSNYGLRFTTDTSVRKYAIVGMEFCDSQGDPVFDPRLLVLAAHEFCHSYTNPVVNKYMDQLRTAGQRFYDDHADTMRRIGYHGWQAVMYESAVRSCVASFTRTRMEPKYPGVYKLYLDREAGFGFVWIKDMDDLLRTYEANRDKYPTFESFFPKFVTFLNEHTQKVALEY